MDPFQVKFHDVHQTNYSSWYWILGLNQIQVLDQVQDHVQPATPTATATVTVTATATAGGGAVAVAVAFGEPCESTGGYVCGLVRILMARSHVKIHESG